MEKKAIRVAYGEAIVKLGAENDKVVVLDADLAAATMTNGFKKAYPDRFIDCGIAEANMVDMAAGMSTMGLIPFCSTFAVFAGRSYDQIRNGVCYPKFNVKFGFSHAGITLGEDGGSHQVILRGKEVDCDEKENFHRSCDSYDAGIYNGHNRVCRSITNK